MKYVSLVNVRKDVPMMNNAKPEQNVSRTLALLPAKIPIVVRYPLITAMLIIKFAFPNVLLIIIVKVITNVMEDIAFNLVLNPINA